MPAIPVSRAAADRRCRFLTVAETADLLGVSTSTVHRAIRAGNFPAIKIGGRYVVPARAIDEMEEAALEFGLVDVADPAVRGRWQSAASGQGAAGLRNSADGLR